MEFSSCHPDQRHCASEFVLSHPSSSNSDMSSGCSLQSRISKFRTHANSSTWFAFVLAITLWRMAAAVSQLSLPRGGGGATYFGNVEAETHDRRIEILCLATASGWPAKERRVRIPSTSTRKGPICYRVFVRLSLPVVNSHHSKLFK